MLEEGLGYIDQAIALDPGAITLKGTKSSILVELDRWEEGLALIEEVEATTEAELDRELASYYRALAIWKSGDTTNAWRLLREAARNHPACVVRARVERIFRNDPA